MFKSPDLQHRKKGSPSTKHRRNAGLYAYWLILESQRRRRVQQQRKQRTEGMFESVQEMMADYLNRNNHLKKPSA